MITYGYSLERDEGDEIRRFGPNKSIPTQLPDIVLIEGPNSSGKSTLLTIMAAGFHGLKVDRLNESLKNKLHDLIESKDQKISFEINLTNKDGSIQLVSRKAIPDNPEIIVEETRNGKKRKLAYETFEREYNLIYDIPDDPLERLNKLVEEVTGAQKSFAMDISALRRHLHEIVTEISNARDPAAIGSLGKKLSESQTEIERRRKEVVNTREFLLLLDKYSVCRSLSDSLERERHLEKQLDSLTLQRRDVVKTGKKNSDKITKQRDSVTEHLDELKKLHYDISSSLRLLIPRKDRNHLDIWDRIDLGSAAKRYEFPASLTRESRSFRGILAKLMPENSKKVAIDAKIYSEIIDFLEKYKHSRIIIPGVEKPIDDFIDLLEESRDKYKNELTYANNIDQTIRNLDSLEELRRTLEGELSELAKVEKDNSKQISSTDQEYEDIEDHIGKCQEELEEARDACKSCKMEAAKKDVNEDNVEDLLRELQREKGLRPYLVYKENQLQDSVDSLSGDLTKSEEVLSKMEFQRTLDQKEFTRLEKVQPHKYQDRLPQLQQLFKKCQILEQKFAQEFDQYADAISGSISEKKLTKPQERYYGELSHYLGRRLEKVRHIDQEYKVDSVDLVRKEIITEKKKRIPFIRMGTGQSQSTYITGLLSTDDTRKIIALFDEVAMMDDTSLGAVFSKLKELYDSDRLLAGIVVQKANTIKVIPKV